MQHATHHDSLARLRRIEGQVRGIARMIEQERYCVEILTQLRAAGAALKKAENEILKDHLEFCVENAIASGNPSDQRKKFEELLTVFGRYSA
jgi:DNA-binding FrmR family transcriptional regulator